MVPIYLVCGVPGSGKTWVCSQLDHIYNYIPHDEHISNYTQVVSEAAKTSQLPILTDCPFGERTTKEQLESFGHKVVPIFIVESPEIVQNRYKNREGKEPSQSIVTRATTILNRAKEWDAKYGTSEEILKYLGSL